MQLPYSFELDEAHRCDPCREYPGEWIVFVNGRAVGEFADGEYDTPSTPSARALAYELAYKEKAREPHYSTVTVGWNANGDDPRIGQAWFTGFYAEKV